MSFRRVHSGAVGVENAYLILARYTVPKPVNRCPLRTAYAGATLTTLLTLVTAESARAHVNVAPRLVEQGEIAQLRIELPRLRAGPAPERLEVEGEGIEVLSSRLKGVAGADTVWSVRVRITAPPGRVLVILRAEYADGESVEVDDTLTVVPAPKTSSFPWSGVVGGTLLALALVLLLFRLARRKP